MNIVLYEHVHTVAIDTHKFKFNFYQKKKGLQGLDWLLYLKIFNYY